MNMRPSLVSPRATLAVCVAAAVLLLASQLVRVAVGLWLGGGSAAQGAVHSLTYGLALLATCVLLLALTAIYAHLAAKTGVLGKIAYVTAVFGTVLVAGDWWFEAFVVPAVASMAPEVLRAAPSGSVLAGALVTVILWTVGWTSLGVAALRSRSVPKAAAILLICSGVLGPLTLSVPYQVPLAFAVGWIGYSLSRSRNAGFETPTGSTSR